MNSGDPADRVRIDLADECIWRHGERITVPPKAFLVLRCLVAQPDQLVTKAQLMEAAWPDAFVADVVLNVAIRQLREAFADDSKVPRYIETVHRRGFRWIGPHSFETSSVAPGPPQSASCVGRATTLAELDHCYARAAVGQRQVAFVTGDSGIGKTAVVDQFVASLISVRSSSAGDALRTGHSTDGVLVGRGQCTESYIAGEAYRPVVEAIETLLRHGGSSMRAVFAKHAPTWMLQMPDLSTAQELEELRRTVTASTGDRMQRELERAIEAASAERCVVLVLEDLHWSDSATVGLLWALAARREAAHLLIIGTYRPVDAIAEQHPIVRMKQELVGKKQCVEILLDGLETEAVATYLDLCFANPRLPDGFAARLQVQTSGNPLFLLNALADFEQRGWLTQCEGEWTFTLGLDSLDTAVPDGTREIISYRLDQLTPAAQELLEAASIAGQTFPTQVLAAAMERSCEEVESECAKLGRGTPFLRDGEDVEWPDGSRGRQHSFRHALYRQVLDARLTPTRRRLLHERIAARLEAGYGDRSGEIAGQLSFHCEHAGDLLRAAECIEVLVPQAYARCATHEAEALTAHAVALVKRLPPSEQRQQRLLQATIGYAMALSASRGAISLDAARAFDDARALGQSIPTSPEHVLSLVALAVGKLMHGQLQESRRIGEEILALDAPGASSHAAINGNLAVGSARLQLGELDASIEHLERSLALLNEVPDALVAVGYGPAVGVRTSLGIALIEAGHIERGLASLMAAVELAKASGAPAYLGFPLAALSEASVSLADPARARLYSQELLAYCEEHGLPYWPAMQRVILAWTEVVETRDPARIDEVVQAVEDLRPVVRLGSPRALSLLADAYLCLGRLDDATSALAEAFHPEWEERINAAELWRLQAAIALARARSRKRAHVVRHEEGEQLLLRALETANSQGARLSGLRITVDLCRLWQSTGRADQARRQLRQAIADLREGFSGLDLRAANELLSQLGG